MPKKELTIGQKYPPGSLVWHVVSNTKGAWRIGIVVGKENKSTYSYNSSIEIMQPGNSRASRQVWDGWRNQIMHRDVIANVPPGTIYLIDTKIGAALSPRLSTDNWNPLYFEVYECGTRMQTKGSHLGYLVIPGCMGDVEEHYKHPDFKTWTVAPSVTELLSFLGAKLPEILAVYYKFHPEEKQNESDTEVQEAGS